MGLILNSLPRYRGPYKVSTHDLEFPSSTTSTSSSSFSPALLRTSHRPALELDTILFTTFYPVSNDTNQRKPLMNWLERPLSVTSRGYSKFLGKPLWLVKSIVYLFGRGLKLSPSTNGIEQPLSKLNEEKEKEKKFPVVVFSHGLSGNRTTYSQFCGELASRGFIVIALEHRDGSGPVSIVKLEGGNEKILDYIKENDIYYENDKDKVPFMEFRRHQLEMRQTEILQTLEILHRINKGDNPKELEQLNRRRHHRHDSREMFEWENWKGKLDLENNLVMAGHSFGGATTIQILRSNEKFRFKSGLALDPWAEPLPPSIIELETTLSSNNQEEEEGGGIVLSTKTSNHQDQESQTEQEESSSAPAPSSKQETGSRERGRISVPFLVINSEAFTLWKPHFYQVREIVESVNNNAQSRFFTILGSIHISFSDIPLFLPSYLSPKKATTSALETHHLITEISVEFIEKNYIEGEYLGKSLEFEGDREFVNREERGEGEKGPLKSQEGEGFVRLHLKRGL
ncbi:hypothetical protein JCM5350_006823 [Sporobolomyces pararoseus]